jgi:hypothetical protein
MNYLFSSFDLKIRQLVFVFFPLWVCVSPIFNLIFFSIFDLKKKCNTSYDYP